MIRIDVEKYIDELRGYSRESKDLDLYSLKKELIDLNKSSNVFENFEEESRAVDKDVLSQVKDLSSLIKIKNLASEIKDKKQISEKLHSLHFNLNLLSNSQSHDASSIKNILDVFLKNQDARIDVIINELNDFKTKLEEIKKLHSSLLSKGLDNRIKIEAKYNKHIEGLQSMHKRQKDTFMSAVNLFLKMAKNHINKSAKI